MATTIDACGYSCPQPVLMARQALEGGGDAYDVLVDNQTAVQNVSRFATNAGYSVMVSQEGEAYRLALRKSK